MVRTKITPLKKDPKPLVSKNDDKLDRDIRALFPPKSKIPPLKLTSSVCDEIEDFSDDDKTVIVEPTDPVIMSMLERKKAHDILYGSPVRVKTEPVCPGAPSRTVARCRLPQLTHERWWCGHCNKANGNDHRWCMEAYNFEVEKWEAARIWKDPHLKQLNDELHK